MPESVKSVVEYEREYAEAMAKALRYNPRASTHAITSPYWDAITYALSHYDPSYKKYDERSVVMNAINQAKSKLRVRTRFEVVDQVAKSIRGLVEFLIDHASRYPKQKTWEIARAIRRSLAEHYYEVVWRYIQEKKREKVEEGEER